VYLLHLVASTVSPCTLLERTVAGRVCVLQHANACTVARVYMHGCWI
jgi:hypothetical protein